MAGLTLPVGEGFVWAAGEASSMRALRTLLFEEKQLSKHQMRVAAYWKQGSSDFHERLDD
ncbi:MAG: SIP domain-containing protein [Vogesella sp.]|uniref:SIP domain-containing protein n=1 Tax=Vogesella sp. TaxID=1904252 RepID=UPI00391A3414